MASWRFAERRLLEDGQLGERRRRDRRLTSFGLGTGFGPGQRWGFRSGRGRVHGGLGSRHRLELRLALGGFRNALPPRPEPPRRELGGEAFPFRHWRW